MQALDYTNKWCCSPHNDDFDIHKLLVGPLLCQNPDTKELYYSPALPTTASATGPPAPKRKPVRYRPTAERKALVEKIWSWRYSAHKENPSLSLLPTSIIISDSSIAKVARMQNVSAVSDITALLEESPEWELTWGKSIYDIVAAYNLFLLDTKAQARVDRRATKAAEGGAAKMQKVHGERRMGDDISNTMQL